MERMETGKQKKLLLVVDPQMDFINGSLPVPGAAAAMDNLAEWLVQHPDYYDIRVVSRDWHKINHCSFKEYGGKWPIHCVENSPGASVWPALAHAAQKSYGPTIFLNKAENEEEYSVFQKAENRQLLQNLVREKEIGQIDICGIAGDICVLQSLKDALNCFNPAMLKILRQFSPSLDGGAKLDEFVREHLPCNRS